MWDEDLRVTPDFRPGPVKGTCLPCGKISDNLSTTLSTGSIHLQSNPYLGETDFGVHIWGC